jgi:hypothetical protein
MDGDRDPKCYHVEKGFWGRGGRPGWRQRTQRLARGNRVLKEEEADLDGGRTPFNEVGQLPLPNAL